MRLILKKFRDNTLVFTYILIQPLENSVLMYTSNPIGFHNCQGSSFLNKIDEFTIKNKDFMNKQEHYNFNRYETFFKCPMRISIFPYYPPLFFEQDGKFVGMEKSMMDLISEKLDFQINYTKFPLFLKDQNNNSIDAYGIMKQKVRFCYLIMQILIIYCYCVIF